jgi:trans-aconitate methyltransferase
MAESMHPVEWDPADYAANSSPQLAWAREQIARLDLQGDERLLDVGCGDGRITAELAGLVPRGIVVGVDSSPAMIAFAQDRFRTREYPNLAFALMEATRLDFRQPFDLIFSNATLHWIKAHAAFLRAAARNLRPGGRLIVSCGGRGNAQDVFAAVRGRMRMKRWRDYFRKLKAPYFFHRPEDYERWLSRCGFRPTRLGLFPKDTAFTAGELAAWLRTTWLPYTQRVPGSAREEFIADVVDRYLTRHPPNAAGRTLVRMVRLELDAVKL